MNGLFRSRVGGGGGTPYRTNDLPSALFHFPFVFFTNVPAAAKAARPDLRRLRRQPAAHRASIDRASIRSSGGSVEQAIGRSVDRSSNREVDWLISRSIARSIGRSVELSIARSAEWSFKKSLIFFGFWVPEAWILVPGPLKVRNPCTCRQSQGSRRHGFWSPGPYK